jgi:hypothetical protein
MILKVTHKGIGQTNRPPDYLIIGPQRSATSWLYKNLGFHPQVWLTPLKELHYFNRDMLSSKAKRKRYLKQLLYRARDNVRKIITFDNSIFRDFKWDYHYFLQRRTYDWYINLFRPSPRQIAGEATPNYAVLSVEKIREIHEMNPDIKLIYLMRNPIERSWSGVTKFLAWKNKKKVSEFSDEEIYEKLNSPDARDRNNHLQSLANWESVFGADQIFIDFFESVVNEPIELLLRIHEFLGISSSEEFISTDVQKKISSSGKYKNAIPRRFHIHLAKQQISQLRSLNQRFSGPTNQWLKRAEGILSSQEE